MERVSCCSLPAAPLQRPQPSHFACALDPNMLACDRSRATFNIDPCVCIPRVTTCPTCAQRVRLLSLSIPIPFSSSFALPALISTRIDALVRARSQRQPQPKHGVRFVILLLFGSKRCTTTFSACWYITLPHTTMTAMTTATAITIMALTSTPCATAVQPTVPQHARSDAGARI